MTLMRVLVFLFSVDCRCSVRPQIFRIATLALLAATLFGSTCLFDGTSADAASINYGTFNVPSAGIMFQNVTESSGTDAVPMYGPPDPFVVGLDFDPANFVSTSSAGAADITDGQLNFTIMGLANVNGAVGVTSVSLSEAGDYTLAGCRRTCNRRFRRRDHAGDRHSDQWIGDRADQPDSCERLVQRQFARRPCGCALELGPHFGCGHAVD